MTRRGLALFALMSAVWGIPYFLIKVAVGHLSPAMVVEGRTLTGALLLLPLALRQGRVRSLARVWKPFLAYTVCEIGVPWFLLSNAERRLPSSLTGLLVATVPLISAVLAAATGDRSALRLRPLGGVLVGLAGVGLLLGLDVHGAQTWSVAQVMVVAVGYAIGPQIARTHLGEESSVALAAVSLLAVALAYLPVAAVESPARFPPGTAVAAILVLGAVCTAVAFVAFFELVKEMPPTKATLITYFNPVVALGVGAVALGESVKWVTLAGFALILAGSALATGGGSPVVAEAEAVPLTCE